MTDTLPCGHDRKKYYYFHPALIGGMRHRCAACDDPEGKTPHMQKIREVQVIKDHGRTKVKHLWIDLDSWNHAEVWLHVFRKRLFHAGQKNQKNDNLIVIEEGGFAHEPKMKIMTRDEFKEEYEIDVPELFED